MRYLPHTSEDIAEMMETIGIRGMEELFASIPTSCCCRTALDLPESMTEWELNDHMNRLAGRTATPPDSRNYTGAGSYDHYIPQVVSNLRGRSEFLTSYTPYQPEISQGTLQAVYEYQTLAARLMGVEVATASHYDGATALAESLLMAIRITRRNKVAVSRTIHPHYRQVVQTYFNPTGFDVIDVDFLPNGRTDPDGLASLEEVAAVAVQSPNFFGCIEPLGRLAQTIHDAGALLVAGFTEAISLGVLKSPGSQGADIVWGEGQSLGLAQSFGGPGLGMLGSRMKYVRNLPGRLVGRTRDIDGRDGFVLTLSTREQHIRRERATSNICSNNNHCALTAVMYMAVLGGRGLRELAQLNLDKAHYLKERLRAAGFDIAFDSPTFNEFVVRFPTGFSDVYKRLADRGIIAGVPLATYYPQLENHYLLCATETASRTDLDTLVEEVQS